MKHDFGDTLTIMQLNVNGSSTAQAELLNTYHNTNIDIIALQEPFFDFQGTTRSSREWVTVY